MAQKKHLHELLQEDQEPFQLKHYIEDRRCQLKKSDKIVKNQKSISHSSTLLCKHVCFLSIGAEKKSPLFSPAGPTGKSPARKMFLHVPASTSSLLLEAAMRIQKQKHKQNRPKQLGFSLFGSILKKMKELHMSRNNNNNRKYNDIKNEIVIGTDDAVTELRSGSSCSCNHSRLSSAGWSSESNQTSSSCRSEIEEIELIGDGVNGDDFPLSPFRFSLQKCPPSSTGCRTPEFTSPEASPARHKNEDIENYEGLANIEQEDEKEQCSPVSVLDPPFDDDGHECEYEDEDEDEENDDCGIECNYALVQRAQQQLLYKLRRFEKLAELDPIELEKLMLEEEEEGNDDLEDDDDDDDSLLSHRDRDFETFASEVTIPFDMKRLVSDLISEEKIETNSLNNREEEVVFGRVCKRLDSWQHVRSDTIDMMIESDFKNELDDWKKFQEQREKTAFEVEVSIFSLLVEELAEEIVHFA